LMPASRDAGRSVLAFVSPSKVGMMIDSDIAWNGSERPLINSEQLSNNAI
jgi:hypothetical protein